MATAKKTKITVQKKAVKTSTIKTEKTPTKQKKADVSKKEKVSNKTVKTTATKKIVKKPLQKLSPREAKLQRIKLKLLHQRKMLLNDAGIALNELPGQAAFPDPGDQASAETDRNFILRLMGREQRLLKKIEQAIERFEAGTFGICENCGNEISIKRIEARPVTTMCIDCKTLQEEEEKLRES